MVYIPFYPTREEVLKEVSKRIIPREGARILDLGSGDARILNLFANKYDDVSLHGVEKNIRLVKLTRREAKNHNKKINIIWGDLFQHNLQGYDIVYTYLTRRAYTRLLPNLIDFIRGGGILIANDIPVTYIRPKIIVPIEKIGKVHRLYIYYRSKEDLKNKVILTI